MRHKNIPNKEELLKTEMKIQDQINQWMQVRRDNKKFGEPSDHPTECVDAPPLSLAPVTFTLDERNNRVKDIISTFKKNNPQRTQIDLNQQITLQKLKLKLL